MKEDFTTETGIGSTYEPELVNKLNRYCNLSGVNRIKFVTDLIEKELSTKVLFNDFIELEEPYYCMLETDIVFGSKINPVRDFHELDLYDEYDEDLTEYVYLIKRISNNLDVWSNEYNTYCYNNNPDLHKGVYIFIDASINSESVRRIPIIFIYNSSTKKLELESVPSFIALKNKLNLNVSYHDFLVDLEHDSKRIEHEIFTYHYDEGIRILNDVNYDLYFKTFEVISPYVAENGLKEDLYIDFNYEGSNIIEYCLENNLYHYLELHFR